MSGGKGGKHTSYKLSEGSPKGEIETLSPQKNLPVRRELRDLSTVGSSCLEATHPQKNVSKKERNKIRRNQPHPSEKTKRKLRENRLVDVHRGEKTLDRTSSMKKKKRKKAIIARFGKV